MWCFLACSVKPHHLFVRLHPRETTHRFRSLLIPCTRLQREITLQQFAAALMIVRPHMFAAKPKTNLGIIRLLCMSHFHQWKILSTRRFCVILNFIHDNFIAACCYLFPPGEEEGLVNWSLEP